MTLDAQQLERLVRRIVETVIQADTTSQADNEVRDILEPLLLDEEPNGI